MSAPYLTLQLSDKTLKKLRALAMLSGSTVDQLEKDFADYFDQMLSENIAALLSQLDGRDYLPNSSSPVSEKIAEPEKVAEPLKDSPAEHSLSEDDLPEETKSIAEQIEEEGFQPSKLNFPDAGEDIEKFLEGTPASKKEQPQIQASFLVGGNQPRSAKKAFNPQAPRVKISDYTGDEEASF